MVQRPKLSVKTDSKKSDFVERKVRCKIAAVKKSNQAAPCPRTVVSEVQYTVPPKALANYLERHQYKNH